MLLPRDDATPHVSGGRLCLGIVNTVLWRRSDGPIERLTSYDAVVHYVARAGWLESPEALVAEAAAHPRKAHQALARVIELRELLFGVFSDLAAGSTPDPADMTRLNTALADSVGRMELRPSASGAFGATWRPVDNLDLPGWQVAASAGAVLASDDRDRVKQCPGPQCGWVFLDQSSNRSRRWCDSTMCGNRARVQAHYQRTRHAG
jgi:predicted RNA-binding Zn ribbon-like protein